MVVCGHGWTGRLGPFLISGEEAHFPYPLPHFIKVPHQSLHTSPAGEEVTERSSQEGGGEGRAMGEEGGNKEEGYAEKGAHEERCGKGYQDLSP